MPALVDTSHPRAEGINPDLLRIVDDEGMVVADACTLDEALLVLSGASWALKRGIRDGARERERELGIQSGT